MRPEFTVVVLNWQRSFNLPKILLPYRSFAGAQIIVWNNNPEGHLARTPSDWISDRVTFINAGQNYGVQARYLAARLATTECILIQDDDLCLPPATIKHLYRHWEEDKMNVHGLYGRTLTAANKYADFYDHDDEPVQVVLGRTMMFSRRLLVPYFLAWDSCPMVKQALGHYPELVNCADDIVLNWVATQATLFPNYVYNLEREELPAPDALCARPNHYQSRELLMQLLWDTPPTA